MNPKLSVVMPVYNRENYVSEAIESVLSQTFSDFEFIIIDDKSTDNSVEVIRLFNDERIRLIVNDKNLGRAGSDNKALELIKGNYVAKMDDDDICDCRRFERQIAFLEANPEINVVGTSIQNFGASKYLNVYPTDPELSKCLTLFGIPMGNATAVFRAALFKENGLSYDSSLRQTEDYDFFARYINALRIASIPEAFYRYRIYPDRSRKSLLEERHQVSDGVRAKLLQQWGIPFTDRELEVHNSIAVSDMKRYNISLQECGNWLEKIISFNSTNAWFDPQALKKVIADRWFYICYFNTGKRFSSWRIYYSHILSKARKTKPAELFKFFIKNLIALK